MTPLEKLDYVLSKTHHSRDYFHVWEDFSKDVELGVNQHDLNMMLNKLQRDGYIDFIAGERYVTGQQVGEGMAVRRNFEGDLFITNGGYVKEASTIVAAEKIKNNREKLLSNGTVWLAILTALLLLSQIIIYRDAIFGVFPCR